MTNPDNIVRVVLTGKYNLGLNKDINLITARFNNKFYSFKIKDSSKLYIDKSQYEYDISLKGEFIRCIMKSNLTDELKDIMISSGIRALSGEDILIWE